MAIDFRNLNTLWASIIVETLHYLKLNTAVVCPGSRSTPLTLAFAQHPYIEAIPVLDERSAAFFALGIAKKNHFPVALVCTSGTAGANFYPAIIEAKESHVPLLILTADRPPELRHCHAGQTIDQVKLYGNYPNWQAELATPVADKQILAYLRQVFIQAVEKTLYPVSGPVHINIPLRDPLAPIVQPEIEKLSFELDADFFSFIPPDLQFSSPHNPLPLATWKSREKGIIIAGLALVKNPLQYVLAVANLSQVLGFPVLAEALSPLRNYGQLNPYLITTYDLILRNSLLAEILNPEIIIQLGELPTSKELRSWLEKQSCLRWIIDNSVDNFDPLHTKTIHIRNNLEFLTRENLNFAPVTDYLKQWCQIEKQARNIINSEMCTLEKFYEGKVTWLLSETLPPETSIAIANSMPVRYMEFFWRSGDSKIIPYFNRGTNGIDGTISTALGIAHRQQSTVLLTGDLAFLYDTNGCLLAQKLVGHLTIILINNNGGGIFQMLPIAQFNPPFEEFFATPQNIDFSKLAATYNLEYKLINNWQELRLLLNPLPTTGVRILEIQTNRQSDALWLQKSLAQWAEQLSI